MRIHTRIFLSLSFLGGVLLSFANDATATEYPYDLTMTDSSGSKTETHNSSNYPENVWYDLQAKLKGKGTCSATGLKCCGNPNITCTCNKGYVKNISKEDCVCAAGYEMKSDGSCTGCTGGYASSAGGKCTICNENYYARGFHNTSCKKCPANSTCTGKGNSDFKCNAGYKQNDNKDACISTCTSSQYLDGSTCKNCPDKCSACSSSTSCSSCKSGNFLSGSTCYACPSNYATCSGSTLTCKSGYYKQGGIYCSQCPANSTSCSGSTFSCKTGYYKDASSCPACSEGCSACTSGTECKTCKDGYFLSNGSCKTCPENCTQCSAAPCLGGKGCVGYVPSGKCDVCKDGYTVVDGQCVKTYTLEIQDAGYPTSTTEVNSKGESLETIASNMSTGKLTCTASGDTITCQCPAKRYRNMSRCSAALSFAAEHGGASGECHEAEAGECGVKVMQSYGLSISDGVWMPAYTVIYYDSDETSVNDAFNEVKNSGAYASCTLDGSSITCTCATDTYTTNDRCLYAVDSGKSSGACVNTGSGACQFKAMTKTVKSCAAGLVMDKDHTYCYKK